MQCETSSHSQLYVQHQIRRIYQMIMDIPIGRNNGRSRRAFLTDSLSKITGLATEDNLRALEHILEQVETGIYQASKMWGDGASSLAASFKLQQDRMRNVFDILGEYRTTIRDMQRDFIKAKFNLYHWRMLLMSNITHFLNNNTLHFVEVDALYNAVQSLVFGHIPHFILPHDVLLNALDKIQGHLDETQKHLVLSRTDFAYYYREASLKTFRKDNVLFLLINAPVTARRLAMPVHLYNVIKFPLPTPQAEMYFSVLSTKITSLAFSREADQIIVIAGERAPPAGSVWYTDDPALLFLDRNWPTCARAIIQGHLPDLKTYCRYSVHKAPYPRGVTRLINNTFLLTNITKLHLNCLPQNFDDNVTEHVVELTHVQTIHTFDCHCDGITADEFYIFNDIRQCNDTVKSRRLLMCNSR